MKYQFTVDSINLDTGHGQVLSQIKPGSCILECGCATGYITKFMKEQLGCKVFIVEYEQQAYEIAREYAEGGVCADLTSADWGQMFEGMQFDYILFMDVLEHLTDPVKTLKESVRFLKQDGTVLISLPNIAHNDILINLHQDSFNYTNLGLLDTTHIRFFGRNNLDDFIRGAGLEMVRLGKTVMKTGQSEQFWKKECRIPEELMPILANHKCGEVYQFIIAAQKEEYCKEHGLKLDDSLFEAECSGNPMGILDVYRQYTQVLEMLNQRNMALLQAEEKVHQQECQLLEVTGNYNACMKELNAAAQKYEDCCAELEQSKIQAQKLAEQHKEASKQLDSSQNALRASEIVTQNLKAQYSQLEYTYQQIISSRGWRFLNKYYKLRDALFPKGSAGREFLKSIARFLFGQKQDAQVAVHAQLTAPGVDPFELINQCSRIDILTVPHTMYIAKLLQDILCDAGLECSILSAEPKAYEDIPYIIICPQIFKHFPSVYIAFQMEQTINPRWLTNEYMNILHNAYAVFDYSLENISFFSKDPLLASKLYYLPVDVCQNMMESEYGSKEKQHDVLFYGDPRIERRQSYLKSIGEKFNLHIASEVFGSELYREMNKAKIVINVHYYENALLETTRLYETLSVSDCLIISERSGDPREEAALEGIVDFVEVGDVDAMMERIRYWLDHEEERREKVAKNREIMKNRVSAAKFYLYRFLLANDRITFDKFYEDVGGFIHFGTDRICLSLPESTERRAAFDADNIYGFECFPGLKHRMGWIGCGMSYKFMLRKAMEQNMEKILICEDDVYFPPDFQERFDRVQEYIEKNHDWNVFSGIMADIGRVKPLKYVQDQNEEFIYLDKMISMVFNLYDKSMFEAISSWDNMNRDVQKNTIDRYLENKKLQILATCPFLVGHKEDLHSTIWGQQNTIYTELIANSSIKLRNLVDDFKKQMENESK